jgi:hypothetical protein
MPQLVYSIGIFGGSSPLALSAIPGLANPVLTHADVTDAEAAFVADPFMVYADGLWYMFFEVMIGPTGRGEIGCATSPDTCVWRYRNMVLREPFHLSYPYVFQWRGVWFMVPETLDAGHIRLYRATHFPDRWEFLTNLYEGAFADTSLFRHGGMWWMFACGTPRRNDRLRLFLSERLTGPWREHPSSPIVESDPHIARPGGRVIPWKSGVIRYTQDCYPTYGRQVQAFLVTTLTESVYREEFAPGNPILPMGAEEWTLQGMHHVDPHRIGRGKWLACVDGYGFLK